MKNEMNEMKAKRNSSILTCAALMAGLLLTGPLALAGESSADAGSSAINLDQAPIEDSDDSTPVALPGIEFIHPMRLFMQERRRARRLEAAQRECLESRRAHAEQNGVPSFPWSMDNLPPACRNLTVD